MFIIANNKWTLFFRGWRPVVVRTWISGVETCVLKGTPEQQVEELKARLRYAGVSNNVTDPNWKPKKTKNRRKR